MSLIHDTELSLFTEVPEDKELNILYYLNQQNTPEVGELESINDLSKLIDMSAINFYVLAGDEIIGFVICFREGSEYKSPNYSYFKNKEDKFLAQGLNDFVVFSSQSIGALSAGILLFSTSWKSLNLICLPLLILLLLFSLLNMKKLKNA